MGRMEIVRGIWQLLITVGVVLLLALLAIAIVLGWSLGWAWLLLKIVPLTLFEAALLILLATIVVAYVVFIIMRTPVPVPDDSVYDDEDEEDLLEFKIPAGRFLNKGERPTSEGYFRYQIANEIYDYLEDEPDTIRSMKDAQIIDLSIRLADLVVGLLKERRRRTRDVRISITQLKKRMDKIGLRPYDDDILQTAVAAVNFRLSVDDYLADIVRHRMWEELDPDW